VGDVSRLTEKQKECLRLVALNFSTKEIARQIGRSDHTVDQRIREALRILEVGDRRTAARILADEEGRGTYQPLIYQTDDLAGPPETAIVDQRVQPEASNRDWRLPPLGGSENDLDVLGKVKLIAGIALAIGGSAAAIIAAGIWVMELVR
jgi:DNA-binding CsgD family transcriptional regulator